MHLILIRHADSEHTKKRIIAISRCSGLTQQGFGQAKLLADRLRTTGELNDCRTLLCSPVLRAQQTANVLADSMSISAVEEDSDLCELQPGEADGLTWEIYRRKFGAFDLMAYPTRPFATNGESWAGFIRRVQATLERLKNQFEGEKVVAITHSGFILASVLVLFDIPRPGTGAYLEPLHTSLTEWRAAEAKWQLVRFNDVYHLLKTGEQANP